MVLHGILRDHGPDLIQQLKQHITDTTDLVTAIADGIVKTPGS
jgi:hypothetical protein